ncbi:MAG: SDR family oxidoreductase, partial [Deltaproteobacteria bacterium]|nr:SDR family oxidoreductase [Deltaproteobacteria bacterium]
AVAAFGGIDAIVNNAGIAPRCEFQEMTWELFDRVQKVMVGRPE